MALTSEQAVDAINSVFGRHDGYRALHAKGTLCKGSFSATPEAAALTRAAHMQGEEIPVTVRLSNGAGNPHHPDYRPDPRGLAVKFYVPDGSRTDIVAVTTPRFVTRTPDGFVEFMLAQKAPWKLPGFFVRHPEALRALPAAAASLRPPPSYAVVPYYGIHAFKWIAADGGERYVRYTWRPQQRGGKTRRDPNYLQNELRERLQSGPIRFTLELQVAQPGDPVDDPTAAWPSSRRRVEAGTLVITALETERETGGDVLVFDPTRVTDGIELSDDPVLRFRSPAYSASVARRTAG
jgi:catalase